jgi:hypothetical protein
MELTSYERKRLIAKPDGCLCIIGCGVICAGTCYVTYGVLTAVGLAIVDTVD